MAKVRLPEPFGEMEEADLIELLNKGKDATRKWDEAANMRKEAEKLQAELNQAAESYNTMAEFFNFVDNTPGLGDVIQNTIASYVQGGGQQPQQGGGPAQPGQTPPLSVRQDPYVQSLEGMLRQTQQQVSQLGQLFETTVYPLAAEVRMDMFKRNHPGEEIDPDSLVQFMNDRRIYDLEDAYKLMRHEDIIKAAEQKGQERVMEGLKKQSEIPKPDNLVPGAEGAGGEPGPGRPPTGGDYGAGVSAALNDPDMLPSLD